MSVAGRKKKGKSPQFKWAPIQRQNQDTARMQNSRRPLWQRLGILVGLEIPHQQDKKKHHSEHADAKVMAGGIRAAR